ncbi:MAG: hypothetical protein RLY93_05455 [Sumerlaeia bacterium]
MLAIVAGLVVFVLLLLHEATAGGSVSLAWLLVLGGFAAHGVWLWRVLRAGAEAAHQKAAPQVPRAVVAGLCGVAVAAVCGFAMMGLFDRIFTEPVDALGTAQMGLIAQATDRLASGEELYIDSYRRLGYEAMLPIPELAIAPYRVVRGAGFDWRFVNILGVAAMASAVLLGLLAAFRAGWFRPTWQVAAGLAAVAVFGCGWLLFPRADGFLHYGHGLVFWPGVLLFGLLLSFRRYVLASVAISVLAALSIGWVVLLPIYWAMIWGEDRRRFGLYVLLTVLLPALAYGWNIEHFTAQFAALVGEPFTIGEVRRELGQGPLQPTLAGLADFLALRPLVYILVILAMVELARFLILPGRSSAARRAIFAIAAFLVVGAAPATDHFHYYAYLVLMAGLVPGWLRVEGPEPEDPLTVAKNHWSLLMGVAVCAAAGAVMAFVPLFLVKRGLPGMVNERPGQVVFAETLLGEGSEWNWRSEDHAWGRTRRLRLRMPLDSRGPARVRLNLGVFGGDWVPPNPVRISVNGREVAVFEGNPGQFGAVDLAFDHSELLIGANAITLDAEWARSPESFAVGGDDRPLSVFYSGLTYRPVAATTEAAQKE